MGEEVLALPIIRRIHDETLVVGSAFVIRNDDNTFDINVHVDDSENNQDLIIEDLGAILQTANDPEGRAVLSIHADDLKRRLG